MSERELSKLAVLQILALSFELLECEMVKTGAHETECAGTESGNAEHTKL